VTDTRIAPVPRCPVHGQMRYRSETVPLGGGISLITRSEWICQGWDGEGCDYVVNHDDLPWQPAVPEWDPDDPDFPDGLVTGG
jgi:hypothetical protein